MGSAGYMHLSGVKLPSRQKTENALYVAVSGKLVGVFLFNYRATAPVQKALYAMRRSRRRPIFAMRDFNVDPLLIARKFGVSSDGFEFPTMLERYRISGIPADRDSPTAALMGRDGLGYAGGRSRMRHAAFYLRPPVRLGIPGRRRGGDAGDGGPLLVGALGQRQRRQCPGVYAGVPGSRRSYGRRPAKINVAKKKPVVYNFNL